MAVSKKRYFLVVGCRRLLTLTLLESSCYTKVVACSPPGRLKRQNHKKLDRPEPRPRNDEEDKEIKNENGGIRMNLFSFNLGGGEGRILILFFGLLDSFWRFLTVGFGQQEKMDDQFSSILKG